MSDNMSVDMGGRGWPSDAAPRPARKHILLVEPEFLFRRTVSVVARQLDMADIVEATHTDAAIRMLSQTRFDGVLVDMGSEKEGLNLVQKVRSGMTCCTAETPIALMTDRCDTQTLAALKALDICRIMLKPFKVKTVLEVVAALAEGPDKAG